MKQYNILKLFALLLFIIGGYVAYQFDVVLFLFLYLIAIHLFVTNCPNDDKYLSCLIACVIAWLGANTNILLLENNIVTNIETWKIILNHLIISWVNIVIYIWGIYWGYFLIQKSNFFIYLNNHIHILLIITIAVNIITFISLYPKVEVNHFSYGIVIWGLSYIFLISKLFTTKLGIWINFLISVSSIVTIVSGIIIIFIILQKFINPENGYRAVCLSCITFINYYQISSVGSLVLYPFRKSKWSKNSKYSMYILILFLCLSLGLVIQFTQLDFLRY